MLEYKGIKIAWLGHDGFSIQGKQVVVTDPFRIRKPDAERFKSLARVPVEILEAE
ncbi:MAG: hypothetical protein HYU64_01170 [Armatimonadetes bacterium]|nr:hypothetical protein [Armatimonadota bacterium]